MMQKSAAFFILFCTGLALTTGNGFSQAAFHFTNGQNITAKQTLANGETGQVDNGATLIVGGGNNAISVKGNATIINSGLIEENGTGLNESRAIRDNTGGLTLSVTNNSTGTIESLGNDAFAMSINGSTVSLNNSGKILAFVDSAQAVNWNALSGVGTNTLTNNAGGYIDAADADSVRPGANGSITNYGIILGGESYVSGESGTKNTGTDTSNDGIDAQSNTSVSITNGGNSTTGALIEGARHGITGGNTGMLNNVVQTGGSQIGGYLGLGTYSMTVTNNLNSTIQGDNGSGVNIDGFGIQGTQIAGTSNYRLTTNENVTLTNYGAITGYGQTKDGDGVDVDGDVSIDNYGSITSQNAVPESGENGPEFSEGVTVGGGTITNEQGATILGEELSGSTLGVGRGITLAGIDHDVNDTPFAIQSIYENSTITNSGSIQGTTESGIAVLGTTGGGYKVTITNNATGTIEGKNSGVAEDASVTYNGVTADNGQSKNQAAIELDDVGNTYEIDNYGTIKQDDTTDGTAIAMRGSSVTQVVNLLNIYGGSASIIGSISGDTALDSQLTINPGAGNSFSYGYQVSNFTTNINSDGTNGTVTLSGAITNVGTTTISGGKLYVNKSLSANAGAGVTVNSTGTLAGSGTITPGTGSGVTVSSGGTMASGSAQTSDATHTVVTGGSGTGGVGGLTLTSTGSSNLLSISGGATLTFALGSNTTGGTLANPNMSSTYLTINDPTTDQIFANTTTSDTVNLVDLTAFSTNTTLQLNQNPSPYLLIQTGLGNNADFANLITSGGTGQNGYILGVSNGSGGVTKINVNMQNSSGGADAKYGPVQLYLYNGSVEVVPEPGTWSLMLGGLALLVFVRSSRRKSMSAPAVSSGRGDQS